MTSVDKFTADVQAQKQRETDTLLSKHRDYGPKNIALSPGGPVNGLRVRLHDKLARLNHLVDSGADPEHEALVDTALDIANYGSILALVLRNQWPADSDEPGHVVDDEGPDIQLGDIVQTRYVVGRVRSIAGVVALTPWTPRKDAAGVGIKGNPDAPWYCEARDCQPYDGVDLGL